MRLFGLVLVLTFVGCAESRNIVVEGDREVLDQTFKGVVQVEATLTGGAPGDIVVAMKQIKILKENLAHLIAKYGPPTSGGVPFSGEASKAARDLSEKQHLPQAGSMWWTALLGVGTTVLGFAVRSGGISAIPLVGPFLSPLVGKFSERLASGANASEAVATTLHEGIDRLAEAADARKTKIMALIKDLPVVKEVEVLLVDGKQTWEAIDSLLAHKNLGVKSDALYDKYVKS